MEIERFRNQAGPTLIGAAVVGFILTRIVVWLPLGFLGTAINGVLWPLIVLSLLAGLGITVVKMNRSAKR